MQINIKNTLPVLLIFLILNFGALAIGGIFTAKGVLSDWSIALIKAPWTPPGWVFGFAWTTIMICFSLYMAIIWQAVTNKKEIIFLYLIQWALNVSWNPAFFYFRQTEIALLILLSLTVMVGLFLFRFKPLLNWKSVLILPYFIWLLIANSLNAFIVINN